MTQPKKRGRSGRLNKSSEDLFTLDILSRRELRLEARRLRRSSAAWAAFAKQPFRD
jgi:hypothetical protein